MDIHFVIYKNVQLHVNDACVIITNMPRLVAVSRDIGHTCVTLFGHCHNKELIMFDALNSLAAETRLPEPFGREGCVTQVSYGRTSSAAKCNKF